jgi:hypothetical protein
MSDLTAKPDAARIGGDIAALEAELAFCEARLSLLQGLPDNLYRRAQLRTYGALEQELLAALADLRRELKGKR